MEARTIAVQVLPWSTWQDNIVHVRRLSVITKLGYYIMRVAVRLLRPVITQLLDCIDVTCTAIAHDVESIEPRCSSSHCSFRCSFQRAKLVRFLSLAAVISYVLNT